MNDLYSQIWHEGKPMQENDDRQIAMGLTLVVVSILGAIVFFWLLNEALKLFIEVVAGIF